jgi:diguanylate cyclase (GGDEF)-like protein
MNSDRFNSGDMLIELFSQLVGASIGNIKLFEKIQRQATTDGLTGLVNHKTFYEILEKELWRSRRYGGQISLIMVDIDNLKNINDAYGHRAGDKAIWEISRRIKECIRQIDTAARYGGDEFAVILLNTSLEDAIIVARRMVDAVANSQTTWQEQIPLSIRGLGHYDVKPSETLQTDPTDIWPNRRKNKLRILESTTMIDSLALIHSLIDQTEVGEIFLDEQAGNLAQETLVKLAYRRGMPVHGRVNLLYLYKSVSRMVIDRSPELHQRANLREACQIISKDIPQFRDTNSRTFNISFDDAC